ncbi:hypothetical protein ACLBKU_12030 [Erythrobacter sp. NE805]|uniref:hypothetical protein n=1 Tax=Erythrobacter sp. NE805 TaxID=3389875 RepID=UPI00396B27EF
MTAAAKTTFGTVLRLAVSGGSLATVAELTSITPPAFTRASVDATSHDSASGAMEYIPDGVFDVGEIPIEGHLILGSTNDNFFTTAINSAQVLDCEIIGKAASGTRKWAGKAIVTAYEPGAMPLQGKQTFSATLKGTGPWTQS